MDNFLPGAASLVDFVDKRLLVSLRDGRMLFGMLRSYDQFANLVLEDAVERLYVDGRYTNIPYGLYVVRGENVRLLGENEEKEMIGHERLQLVSEAELKPALAAERARSLELHRKKGAILSDLAGFSNEMLEF